MPENPAAGDPVTAYARAVVGRVIVAGPYVRAACERHLNDLASGSERGLRFDVDAVAKVIRFFRALTIEVEERQTDGSIKSKVAPFELQPWQVFIVGSLVGWKNADGLRRFRRAYIEAAKGCGKALALDTPIPTPSGWRDMRDLQPGDAVFDELGKPCRVTAVTPEMIGRPCYRVQFSDGAEIIADAEHLWVTTALRSGGAMGPKPASAPRKGKPHLRTTREIAATLRMKDSPSKHPQAKWNHRVEIAGPLELPEVVLPIPPYTLGAWLGDGNSDDARLTVAYSDWGIVEEIEGEGVVVAERAKQSKTTARVILGSGGRTQAARNKSLQSRLRVLGLKGNKHIPQLYLRASGLQRLALLQGLMDSDGHAVKNGQCELCLTSETLARGAIELIRSLGIKAGCKISDAKLYGRVVSKRYRITFFPLVDFPVFRLPRKIARLKAAPATRQLSRGRMIVGCEPIEPVPVKCISVDSPSRMYLAGREMVPTHNSPLAAGIGHYFLCGKGIIKERGEVYSAATSREQATILFRDAIAMWRRSPGLRKRLTTKGKQTQTISQLTHIKTDSIFRPVSAENKGQSGLRPYCALIDEVHEHTDNTVIEMMRAGTKGNQEALIFEITNAGFDKRSVCGQEHDYSVQVVTGEVQNDAWFAFICSLDEGDEPFEDESCWPKANPNLGVSIHPAYIREQVQEAKGMPSKEGTVRRLNFCQWTDSENQAIPRELWEACEGNVDPDALTESGYRCFGGLDLSRVGDLTAFTLTWLVDETKDKWKFASKTWFWTPKDTLLERSKKDRSPYDVWAKQGHMEAVSGKLIKFPWVADALLDLCAKYNPESIGCDQYGLTQLLDNLGDTGATLPCVVHPQGFQKRVIGERDGMKSSGAEEIILWMPDSINKLEAALLEKRITVDINPVMRMCSQAVVYTMNRTGHRMFDKEKATRRIDGMVSLAMSLGMATSEPSNKFDLGEFLASAVMR